MIHVGDDDLVARAVPGDQFADAEADQPNERRRVEAEGNLIGPIGVDENGDALARLGKFAIDARAVAIFRHPLHVEVDEMFRDRVDDALRNLRPARVLEKDEIAASAQRWKFLA